AARPCRAPSNATRRVDRSIARRSLLPTLLLISPKEIPMETRLLGRSGLKVPVLGFGAGTFGGKGPLFSAWGDTGVEQARRMIDLCLEAGLNLFDTADVYSDGASEEILGAALQGRREQVLISTKTGM